ncbi:unnamed protein product [Triticum turgidum subsp. durum]|uniref:Uncharacterized protein n=1 Tax=Triticum turgidum subsp. durum TaxID=4567 RepID=A0A9R0QWX6_TRITD|nr:unnamed protein product [Triticum turgidum subsp. durum]
MTSIEVAAAGGSGKRTWVSDVEKTLNEADKTVEVAQWERHCIYRVPACIKDIKSKAYQPQVVSLGPFHHGDPNLLPMEEHKRRALRHLLRRAGRPLDDFVAAVEDIAEQLESAYMDLGGEWRAGIDGKGRERFLQMMIVDGCFLLEVMRRTAAGNSKQVDDYAGNDPIFSRHGILYMVPYIKRDMLMLFGEYQKIRSSEDNTQDNDIIRSAVELYEAGIQFKTSKSSSLHNIRFKHGVLSMPTVPVDDSTEYMFLNMMAFERLHVGAGNDVTAYVFFMDNIIDSAKDVALLSSKGIIQNAVGSDKAVAKLFNSISRDVVLEPDSALDAVQRQVNGYFRQPWNMWRANLIHTYFRSPWAFLSLAAAVFLLVMTIMQTVYTVLPFYKPDSNSPPSAPSPM